MITKNTRCRSCAAPLNSLVVDLGSTPLANSFLTEAELHVEESTYPLELMVCETCWLVQLRHEVDPKLIFEDYAYFSSVSDSWLRHCEEFAEAMTTRLELDQHCLVVEVASNDGHLLRNFHSRGIGVLGVEPAANVAASAIASGIATTVDFLTVDVARQVVDERGYPDLLIGNNVLAHVPDINGFVDALAVLMSPKTLLTMEFPHVLNLIDGLQFDTIYHEHYSYLSLFAVEYLFARHDLVVVDVEHIPTHGGSLRIYAKKALTKTPGSERLEHLRLEESAVGLKSADKFSTYGSRVGRVKASFVRFLEAVRDRGDPIAAYGAAAKGNTLINTCGVDSRHIEFVVDRSHYKQGLYMPGSRIPIVAPEVIFQRKPDYLVILPWNLRDEIMNQMDRIREWGGQFVTAIPETRVLS